MSIFETEKCLTSDQGEFVKYTTFQVDNSKRDLLCIGTNLIGICDQLKEQKYSIKYFEQLDIAYEWVSRLSHHSISAILLDDKIDPNQLDSFIDLSQSSSKLINIPLILFTDQSSNYNYKNRFFKIDDVVNINADFACICTRIDFIIKNKNQVIKVAKLPKGNGNYKLMKRVFDISVATSLLIVFSPVFLLISIFIFLESRGSVFYISKRVGTNYRVFNFYKFRTMQSNADIVREQIRQLNHYYSNTQDGTETAVFFKVKNDPRITKVGKILRKTSLDELPQLINILKGDMSVVGNRPLPLDEGANLTKDQWAARFLAPAGLTGLWQVSKATNDKMSVRERIQLDLYYAKHWSFWLDMKIILKTLPAMLQKEEM